MKQNFALLTLLFVFVLSSCDSSKDTTGPDNTNKDTIRIMPLKVGNSWTYEKTRFESDGTILNSRTYISKVTSSSIISGETFYAMDSIYGSYNTFLVNRANGLWELNGTYQSQIAKYPCTVGDKFQKDTIIWQSTDCSGNIQLDTSCGETQVLAVNTPITVNDSIYSAIKYQTDYSFQDSNWNPNYPDIRYITYYAPSIGMIRREYYSYDGTTHVLYTFYTLKSYSFK